MHQKSKETTTKQNEHKVDYGKAKINKEIDDLTMNQFNNDFKLNALKIFIFIISKEFNHLMKWWERNICYL